MTYIIIFLVCFFASVIGSICGIGILLGMMSSFLGIGGGPINLIVLFYLFSMETKQAAIYSIYIIMFSQNASLITALITNNVPEFQKGILILMIFCGITGGMVGSKIHSKIDNRTVDRFFKYVMALIIGISIYNICIYCQIKINGRYLIKNGKRKSEGIYQPGFGQVNPLFCIGDEPKCQACLRSWRPHTIPERAFWHFR